jgi:hypothetical protein
MGEPAQAANIKPDIPQDSLYELWSGLQGKVERIHALITTSTGDN